MKRFMMAMLAVVCTVQMLAGDIFVSPTGSDANPGTREKPLATLDQALRQAREWRRLNRPEVSGGIRIVLMGGRFELQKPVFIRPEDSGTEQSPTVIAAEDSTAVLSGGICSTVNAGCGWQKGCSDPRIAPHLRDKIWTADAPMVGNRLLYFRQMNLGRSRMARQFGTVGVEGVGGSLPIQQMERMQNFDVNNRTITIPTPQQLSSPSSLASRPQLLEMLVHQRWATAILRVKEVRRMGDSTVVSFHEPESKLEFEHPWPQPVIGGERGNSSYCLQNALELLDEPGEWYQDYPSGKIYYYPIEDNEPVTMPALTTLLNISGTPERRVHHVRFERIRFMDAAWNRPSQQGHVTLQGGFAMIDAYKLKEPGLPEKAELENQAWIERPDAAVKVSYADDVVFENCVFKGLGATALDMEKSVTRSTVGQCRFCDIGGTAIMVGTFPDQGFETHVPYSPKHKEDICDSITIIGNSIARCTLEDWGAVGIGAGYVSNIRIVDNDVHDLNYSGICVGWGWTALPSGMHHNQIEGNHVYNYAKQLYDAGGIYTLSYQPNSFIRNNRIEAPVKAPYATNDRAFCIYFDEATDGYMVENNWMPRESFGYNKPGPRMVIRNNGPQVKVRVKN